MQTNNSTTTNNSLFLNYCNIDKAALSALTLLENNLLCNAYPICRGIIELYIKTLILEKHPEAMKEYHIFTLDEIEQSCCSQKYPQDFNERFEKRKQKTDYNKINYLHFGWLDAIDGYDSNRKKAYSIYGIIAYLQENADSTDYAKQLDNILRLYKMCNGYTHGSVTYVKYPLLQYFEISTMLYYVLRDIYVKIRHINNSNGLDNKTDILFMLDRDFSVLDQQYQKRSPENFDLYYKIWKNSQYPTN